MSDTLIVEPAPGPPVVELHVWIGHYADGSEGILGGDLPLPQGLGTRFMPMMNAKREVADRLGVFARRLQETSQHLTNRITRIELRTYRAVMS